MRSLNAPIGSPKLFLTAQGVGRGGAPRKSAAAQHFAMRQIALPPHDVRYAMWARHCTKNGADSTVGMPQVPRTTSSARGQRGTNRELRGRSCELPRARGPARGYSRCGRRRCGRRRRRFGTLSLRRPARGLPAAGAPQTPYRLQPLFCVNISHYLKYVRSKFAGLSYERGRATVFSHFGCRALQWAARPGRSRRCGFLII